MATNKAASRQIDNTDEIESLSAQIEDLKGVQKRMLNQIQDLKSKNDELTKELIFTKDSLEKAQTRNETLEAANGITPEGDKIQSGNVVIATLPSPKGGILPVPGKINGIMIPRKLEDGVLYETMPVKNAVAILSDGSGFRRALVGPTSLEKIEGDVVKQQGSKEGIRGTYSQHVVHYRHKLEKTKNGPRFVKVEIEESKQKAD